MLLFVVKSKRTSSSLNKAFYIKMSLHIDFSKMPAECSSYTSYISRIEKRLKADLLKDFPDAECSMEDALWDILDSIFDAYHGQKFLFVMDEWDYIFHRDFILDKDQKRYLQFLSNLLSFFFYLAVACAVALYWYLNKTRSGLGHVQMKLQGL